MRAAALLAACAIPLCGPVVCAGEGRKHSVMPAAGLVPTAATAIQIAVAVWTPIYGKQHIQNERPFRATLQNGVWTVTGSLPKQFNVGGVAVAEIAKRDGRILRVSHGK